MQQGKALCEGTEARSPWRLLRLGCVFVRICLALPGLSHCPRADTRLGLVGLPGTARSSAEPRSLKVDEWITKAVVHLQNGALLSHKKEGNLTFSNSVDGPGEHYAE